MTAESPEPLDLAPFELLTQKDQWQHIAGTHHQRYALANGSKSTKGVMEDWHQRQHQTFNLEHTHTAVVASKDVATIPTGGKLLPSSQRKALRELVDNDFQALRAEINQFAADIAHQRREEVRQEFSERGSSKAEFVARANSIMETFRKDSASIVAEAAAVGVELFIPSLSSRSVEGKTIGLDAALRAAQDDVEADRKRALTALERARLMSQRAVLIAGVDAEALTVLDEIPNARDLMAQAHAARAGQS